MKTIVIVLITMFVMSCNKECEPPQLDGCADTIPTGTLCQAAFQSWLYNEDTNTCELMGYSGCNAVGFATEAECEECKCHN